MKTKTNPNCTCPITNCKRHGDCKACAANHTWAKPYCKRPEDSFGRKITDKIFGKKKG